MPAQDGTYQRVSITTVDGREIVGEILLVGGVRLKDALNNGEPFLVIRSGKDADPALPPFRLVNKAHIVTLVPEGLAANLGSEASFLP